MGLARVGRRGRVCRVGPGLRLLTLGALMLPLAPERAAFAAGDTTMTAVADRDDDDLDGSPDGAQTFLPVNARVDLVPFERRWTGWSLRAMTGSEHARVIVGGHPVAWGRPLEAGAALQGLTAGRVNAIATRGGEQATIVIDVFGVGMRDGENKDVDLAHEHASLERTPPARLEGGPDSRYEDPDALRVTFTELQATPATGIVSVETVGPTGARVDLIPRLALSDLACPRSDDPSPDPVRLRCSASVPLRFVVDEVDRRHPLVEARSLRAEMGGAVVVRKDGRKLQAIRIRGPRKSRIGAIDAFRATIHPVVMRVTPGGVPAIGGTDKGAVESVRSELALASAIWGQCGLTFGPVANLEVKIAEPPPAHLVSIGDDLGLPASGGEVRLRADGHALVIPISRGDSADVVAGAVARAVTRVGLLAVVSTNTRIAPGAASSVDVSIRKTSGVLVGVEPLVPSAPLTTDATLSVRIGSVDLSDGLQHFGDMDSMAGTLEERTLLKAVEDGDPRTLDVVIVPFFAGGGRIGESFIGSDLSSVRDVVILDRAGIRARRSSLTLAHELGHVLLDMPGHPDDFGVDTPSLLMDSDASDSSPFGPRRITTDECARVIVESGPGGRAPLLEPWHLSPIHYAEPATVR